MPDRAYLPDLLYMGGRFRAGAALSVQRGVVAAAGDPVPGLEVLRLPGQALIPGFVSAHSHAFQRAIRGRTERRPEPPRRLGAIAPRADFWTWRTAMYAVASRLSPDDLEAVARMCFREMLRAGITCVGEFHYLHRDPEGNPYADGTELARRIVAAAGDAGVRLVLLRAAYARAGFGKDPDPVQLRFIEPSPEAYLQELDRLKDAVAGDPLVSLGIGPHSVRACPAEWIAALAAEARRRELPLHLHVAEQPAEVQACREEYGTTPALLLERVGALTSRTTAVHAIHLSDDDARALGRAGATVCACPTTERNLGDGIVPAHRLYAAGVRLAIGTDSNVQIDPMEDARELEYHLRIARLSRAVLDDPPGTLASRLFGAATAGGMASLGVGGGRLAPGEPADFVGIDLEDPSVAGAGPDELLATIVFSLARTAIRGVYVAGEPVLRDGETAPGHMADEPIRADFQAAMGRIWGTNR